MSARAWVDSSNYQLGDPITLHIELRHARGARVQPPVGDSLGRFTVLGRMPVTPAGDSGSATGLVLAYYDSGTVMIPPAEVPYSMPGDSAIRLALTNPVPVSVHLVAVDTSKDYRDLKPPMSLPITLAELARWALVVLALAAAGYLLYRWWKRRARKAVPAPPPAPDRPADVLALEELAVLHEQRLWQQGRLKEYYSGVTEILRRYFERRFGVPALEETTGETLEGLHRAGVPGQAVELTARMLRLADLVKFAKHEPAVAEHEEMMTLGRTIVQETRLAAAPQAAAAGAQDHVGS